MELSNHIRYYHYVSGVLSKQKSDPLCGDCKAFANTVRAVRESIDAFERGYSAELSEESTLRLSEIKKLLSEFNLPADAIGQKKAGNCKMPEGVCFVKVSKSIIEKIS